MKMPTFYIFVFTFLLTSFTDGYRSKKRFLAYNPADLSTALGYQNHQVHDLTSLVDEASGAAHATGNAKTQTGQAAYNVPNFPAMGQNKIQSQTGSLSSSSGVIAMAPVASGKTGSGSASFSGTNQWRCDAHIVETCDLQCLDVDPKDGCPFCIPGCQGVSPSGGQGTQSNTLANGKGTLNNGSQSGNGNQNQGPFNTGVNQSQNAGTPVGQSGNTGQNIGTLTGTAGQSGNLGQNAGTLTGTTGQSGNLGQNTGTLTGTAGQSGAGLGGTLTQQNSGLSGTGGINQGLAAKQGTSGGTLTNAGSTNAACPYFPPNCPQMYTALDSYGCLDCTILSKKLQTTKSPVTTTTTAPRLPVISGTCAPKRCVAPCNIGIVLDSSGCPQCRCPDHI